MATSYLTPGVYVEEVPSQSKPIEGVGTSTAAFIGLAPYGPVNKPVMIPNWTQFVRTFSHPDDPEHGPFMSGAYLAHAVYGYFQNGGGLCYVVRVGGGGEPVPPRAVLPAAAGDGADEALRAVAQTGVEGAVTVELQEEEGDGEGGGDGGEPPTPTYRMVVSCGAQREEFDGLSLKKGRSNIVTKVNAASKLITIEDTSSSLPELRPRPGSYTLTAPPAVPEEVEAGEFEGDVARREGLGSLAAVDEITMLCAPDLMTLLAAGNGGGKADAQLRDLQGKMISHCEAAKDRVAILDPPPGLSPQEVLEWRQSGPLDSKFATLYYPWLEVMDPLTGDPMMVPPSGHMAGVWARSDDTRGVHKAPANEVVMGPIGLGFQVTHEEQGSLNTAGINCIRAFRGRGIRVWGARTLSSDPEWRYLNVRRLFNYISESILEGTQWAVFEPNDERLWIRLRIAVGSFLTRTWRGGALFGATPEQAFYVKCDAETNPTDVIEAGQVVMEIGIAPVKPAEFVIFRISQFAAGASEVS
ncbi:MAG: phage tail sheath family protein [Gaiellales bacterium]